MKKPGCRIARPRSALALLGILILSVGVSYAHRQPPECNGINVALPTSRVPVGPVFEGDSITYTVSVTNNDAAPTITCDAFGVTVKFCCPGQDGQPLPDVGANCVTLATNASFPANGPIVTYPSVTCPIVGINPGVTGVVGRAAASGRYHGSGADPADTHPFDIVDRENRIFNGFLSCSVQVDKQVSCDGGLTWVDAGYGDGVIGSCTGLVGSNILVRYRARNTGTAGLVSCNITDSNAAFPGAPVGTIGAGGETNFFPTPGALCEAARPGEPNTATINCECFATGTGRFATDSDTASFECEGGDEICRTPGFWGTHARQNPVKVCSQDITGAVINWAGGLSICGHSIQSTPGNPAAGGQQPNYVCSSTEALCVRVKGNPVRQLARQLTAAALNCVVSGSPGNADCTGSSIEVLFAECNDVCINSSTATSSQITSCIKRIDCFNNGGTWDAATLTCLPGIPEANCHDRPLPLADIPGLPNNDPASQCYGRQGPAGSEGWCSQANESKCTVVSGTRNQCQACP